MAEDRKAHVVGERHPTENLAKRSLPEVSTSSFSLSGPLDRVFGGTQACGFQLITCHMSREGWGSFQFLVVNIELGGGNSHIFYFHPYLGKIPTLTNIFQMD